MKQEDPAARLGIPAIVYGREDVKKEAQTTTTTTTTTTTRKDNTMIRLVSAIVVLFLFFAVAAYFDTNPAEYWLHVFPGQVQRGAQQAADDWLRTRP